MLKRTACLFYGDRQSRMHRHADEVMRAPLQPLETMKDREGLAMDIRVDADVDMEKRKGAHANNGGRKVRVVQGQARRAVAVPRQQTGRAQNKRERIACLAAVKRAHEPKPYPRTGKQRRAAAKASNRVMGSRS